MQKKEGQRQDDLRFRHEVKHYINQVDFWTIQARLKHMMTADGHAGRGGGYRIRSLYFDNFEDKALREKMQGVNKREKFRIRYYGTDMDFIRLEKKSKVGVLCAKESQKITKEQCDWLINGQYTWMRESEKPLFLELYAKLHYQQLRPVSIVEYMRYAYWYKPGNVRVTLDADIRATGNVRAFFDLEKQMAPATKSIIMEVKYDAFLPRVIQDIIQLKGRQSSAFSKYAAGRMARDYNYLTQNYIV